MRVGGRKERPKSLVYYLMEVDVGKVVRTGNAREWDSRRVVSIVRIS